MKYFYIIFFLVISTNLFSQTSTEFIRGADISYTQQIEFRGGKYKLNGVEKEILDLLKENGVNYIRLRLWHTPSNGYNNLSKTLEFAQRIKSKGLKFLLNFHYSDTWADPSHQTKPFEWRNLSFEDLKDSVYEYSKRVITLLKNQNTLPDMVQIGNEISGGMLWPDGQLYGAGSETTQWNKFTELLKEGIRGVKDAADTAKIKIMIHKEEADDYNGSVYFYDRIVSRDVEFDVIGLSYYPWWSVNKSLSTLQTSLNSLAVKYSKEIILVEVAYPWTLGYKDGTNNIVGLQSQLVNGYPASEQGQKDFLTQIKNIIKQTTNNKGLGFFYWEPGWIAVTGLGSAWENCALFDFSNEATDAITVFNDSTGTSVDETFQSPTNFYLFQNYPNPFNPTTTIEFSIHTPTFGVPYREGNQRGVFVALKVYDVLGREIATLVNEYLSLGVYTIKFSADDYRLSSGIYFYKLQMNGTSVVRKMNFLK